MQGLYKKVLRGHYPKIPNHFSSDLANVIKPMLQVSAHLRPSCCELKFIFTIYLILERILQMSSVTKRVSALFDDDYM